MGDVYVVKGALCICMPKTFMEEMESLEHKFHLERVSDLPVNTKETVELILHCMVMELQIKDKYLKLTILQNCGIFQLFLFVKTTDTEWAHLKIVLQLQLNFINVVNTFLEFESTAWTYYR